MAGVVNRSFVGDDGQVPDSKTTTNGTAPVASDTTVDTTSTGSGEREKWDNGVEFLLSCIAMSVGLGNVWKFPSTAFRNGGGAFVIPYMIVLLVVGRPVYYLEMVMGQFSSRGSVKVYDVSPVLRGRSGNPCKFYVLLGEGYVNRWLICYDGRRPVIGQVRH